MSDLRKAIEELADKWEVDGVVPISELREALDANPEPEPEWGVGYFEDGHGAQVCNSKDVALHRRGKNGQMVFKRTAPGPWVEVGDDE